MNWPAAGPRSAPIPRKELLNKHIKRAAAALDGAQQADHPGIQRPGPEDDPRTAGRSAGEPARVPEPVSPGPDLPGRPRPVARATASLRTIRAAAVAHAHAISPPRSRRGRPGLARSRISAHASPSEHRLPFETPIYEMEARLARDGGPLRQEPDRRRCRGDRRADPPAPPRAGRAEARRSTPTSTPGRPSRSPATSSGPQTRDYLDLIFDQFLELHGDRAIGDDKAIVTGLAHLDDIKVMFIGHQKGKNLAERTACNFGCAHPEGYRKALVKMRLAAKFGLPIISFIDTPGAYPGIAAEERGQAAIIAENLMDMSQIDTPIVCVVIGEGGSGGALGIGIGDRLAMLEHAYYSVISPEGCATILWKASEHAPKAAAALKMTSRDLLRFGISRRGDPRAARRRPPRPPRSGREPQVLPDPRPPRDCRAFRSTNCSIAATRSSGAWANSWKAPLRSTACPTLPRRDELTKGPE